LGRAAVALRGALIGDILAAHGGAPGDAINLGFVGFNGVAYSEDLRLVALAAVLSTWLFSVVHRSGFQPVLASGFVLSI
jgi:hypothetical protein